MGMYSYAGAFATRCSYVSIHEIEGVDRYRHRSPECGRRAGRAAGRPR